MTPVQVTELHRTPEGLLLGLSHKVRDLDQLEVNIQGVPSFEIKHHGKNISSKWALLFDQNQGKIQISIKQKATKNQFESLERVKLFRSFSLELDLDNGSFEALETPDDFIKNLSEMIQTEYQNIKELTDFEPGLKFALHRLLELKMLEFEYLKNPFYLFESSIEDNKDLIEQYIEDLIALEQSEINAKLYYKKVRENFEEKYRGVKEYQGK